jgi:glycosyltransferase involved in cell wall biosynthesis
MPKKSRRFWSFIGRLNKLNIVQFGLRGLLLPLRVEHLSGPRQVASGADDVIVISVMRNGEVWLESFLAHHRRMGIRNFVILDNGSSDRSIEILSKQPDVTLLRTYAPYHAYENTMKRYLARRYCRDRWCLCLDVDELFDFPRSATMPLSDLVGYLNNKGFNAVITQMLDMFRDGPISEVMNDPEKDLRTQNPFYDISNITSSSYTFGQLSNPAIMMHHGGIRKTIFGTNNGLTKVSFFLMDAKLKPFVLWHHALNARLADISCVLLHFPFVSSFYAKVVEAAESGRYGYLTTDEYTSYLSGLQKLPQLNLKLESAKKLATVDELLESGFLIETVDYRRWASTGAGRSPSEWSTTLALK